MKGKSLKISVLLLMGILISSQWANAQFSGNGLFKDGAFGQSYNNDQTSESDSAEVLFSIKDYFKGLGHKMEQPIGAVAGGSAIFVGGMQIYNKDYWKLPVIYGGIGAGLGFGFHYNDIYKKSVDAGNPDNKAKLYSTLCFVGAGAFYWGSFMDGVICYKPNEWPHHGKATMYSILCPGLGQIYNHEIWKLPLYWGGMATAVHFYLDNKLNYERFRDIYNQATDPESGYSGPYTDQQALYYRNIYRRYRDYSMLAIAVVYLLQVIDANVFSYMHNFEVDDDLSLDIRPTVITPDCSIAYGAARNPAMGLSLGVKF